MWFLLFFSLNPVLGGLLLLMTCLILIFSCQNQLVSYLIFLVYISGILVLLLYLTNLVNNLKIKINWIWLMFGILSSMMYIFFSESFFQMQWVSKGAFLILSLLFSFLLILIILLLVTKILEKSLSLRTLK